MLNQKEKEFLLMLLEDVEKDKYEKKDIIKESEEISKEDFLKRYGNTKVKFKRYDKYFFTYEGKLPGNRRVGVEIGGTGEDIANIEVTDDEVVITSLPLSPISGRVFDGVKLVETFLEIE